MRVNGAMSTRLAGSRSPSVTGENKSMPVTRHVRTATIPRSRSLRRSSRPLRRKRASGERPPSPKARLWRSVLPRRVPRSAPGVPGLAAVLGAVHRPVRADDQLVGGLARPPDRDPDAHPAPQLSARSGERAADLLPHLPREDRQPIAVAAPADQHELVAPEP